MTVVVVGASDLIETKLVDWLGHQGHEVVAASPKPRIDTITGGGLREALERAAIVVDVAKSPSFEEHARLEPFRTCGRNLLAAEATAEVRHHVALSIVGTDRSDNDHFRAKLAEERLIETSGTIVRSTQLLEFLGAIAAASTNGNVVRFSPGLFPPIAADKVARLTAEAGLAAPQSGIIETAGPERAALTSMSLIPHLSTES